MDVDTGAVRHLAAQLTERADEIRDEAKRLSRLVTVVPWAGFAADAMRAQARQRLAALDHNATLHDDAAAALRHHADAVDLRAALLVEAAQAAAAVAEHAVDAGRDAVGAVVDAVRELPGVLR